MPGAGFEFRSMRSTWRKAGKHVTICREEGGHFGFPDVAQAGPDSNHLVCVWRNSSHTGGSWNDSISHSYDQGQTWSPRAAAPAPFNSYGHVPRIRRLSDGSLVMLDDWGNPYCSDCGNIFLDSTDGGHTWINERTLYVNAAGGTASSCPSRVTELSDGSWLIANSRIGDSPAPIWVEIFRSTDRGQSWVVWSDLTVEIYGTDEASIVELPDGRLLIFTRGNRSDNMPSVRAFSDDMGLTWDWFESPFQVTGRTVAGLLNDGRAMVTYRSNIGRAALWGWVGDPNDMTGFQISAGHFNDHESVGLKDGELHIDNDGCRGQFTMYNMRPPDTGGCVIDVTAEVKVLRNDGYAATLSVPRAGKLRIFPDHIEMAHDPAVRVDVTPGVFHTYRVVAQIGQTQIYVDGALEVNGNFGDSTWGKYSMGFGNEQRGSGTTEGDVLRSGPDVFLRHISPDTTGYSIWKRVEQTLDDPVTGLWQYSWVASTDGFPDEYQMDHIIEIDATVSGCEQGYSGWVQLDDGRIFVVHYTDDTAAASLSPYANLGIPWIRGTFLELSDLPPAPPAGP
ncbi:sialidase family protein, partial [Planctomycetota bacterium]